MESNHKFISNSKHNGNISQRWNCCENQVGNVLYTRILAVYKCISLVLGWTTTAFHWLFVCFEFRISSFCTPQIIIRISQKYTATANHPRTLKILLFFLCNQKNQYISLAIQIDRNKSFSQHCHKYTFSPNCFSVGFTVASQPSSSQLMLPNQYLPFWLYCVQIINLIRFEPFNSAWNSVLYRRVAIDSMLLAASVCVNVLVYMCLNLYSHRSRSARENLKFKIYIRTQPCRSIPFYWLIQRPLNTHRIAIVSGPVFQLVQRQCECQRAYQPVNWFFVERICG